MDNVVAGENLRMFALKLRKATETKQFLITHGGADGWEVREEENSVLVRTVRYADWHRVERARMVIERRIATLCDAGWTRA
jgi:hypothetical protein